MTHLRSTLAAGLMLAATTMMAAPLTPQQALQAARGGSSMLKAPAATDMELVYTLGGETPTVYVFAEPDGAPGFLVLSADDCARTVLGYSEDTTFDPANIPPQLVDVLQSYSASVARLASDPDFAELSNLVPSTASTSGRAKEYRRAIEPICTTQWNQSAPYNVQCPLVGGSRAVTGCVATAMAQVMKAHNWPPVGVGSKSYTFKSGSTTYTESMKFDTCYFDWDNMLDTYKQVSYTTTQRDAVALLMHACGVAASMGYSSSSSGAVSARGCAGMVNYFQYDPMGGFYNREWFYAREWNDRMYAEVAAGRPVYMSGNDGSAGHAFVCDGYAGDEYFHINWGWGGTSDGYFLLTDLNPAEEGIGGGGSGTGYVNSMGAYFGAKPKTDSSQKMPVMYMSSNLTISSTSINRTTGTVKFNTGIYSQTLANFSGEVGVMLIYDDGTTECISYTSFSDLAQFSGYSTMSFSASKFPVGEYLVTPACRFTDGDWYRVFYPKTTTNGALRFSVTSATITVTNPGKQPDDPGPSASDGPTAMYQGSTPAEAGGVLYKGESYDLTFRIGTVGAYDLKVVARLVDAFDDNLAVSAAKSVSLKANDTIDVKMALTVPADLETKRYRLSLAYVNADGSYTDMNYSYMVAIEPLTTVVQAELVSITPDERQSPEGYTDYTLYRLQPYDFTYSVYINQPEQNTLTLRLMKKSTLGKYSVAVSSAADTTGFAQSGTWPRTFQLTLPATLSTGTYYLNLVCTNADGSYEVHEYIPVKVVAGQSGIESIEVDEAAGVAAWYTLQGVRVATPQPGGVYIRVSSDGTTTKVRVQ